MKRIPKEKIAEIKEYSRKGAPVEVISVKCHCTKGFVRDVLRGKYKD